MKRSRQETAETRKNILKAAAVLFRKQGIEKTGLAEVMADTGLTHGGFYRHFASKEQLVREACDTAFCAIFSEMERRADDNAPGDALRVLVNGYLSARQRDSNGNACPLATLGAELGREEGTREVASEAFDRFVSIVANQLEHLPAHEAKAQATGYVSAMVGSMMLARLVRNRTISDAILKHTKDFILRSSQHESPGGPS